MHGYKLPHRKKRLLRYFLFGLVLIFPGFWNFSCGGSKPFIQSTVAQILAASPLMNFMDRTMKNLDGIHYLEKIRASPAGSQERATAILSFRSMPKEQYQYVPIEKLEELYTEALAIRKKSYALDGWEVLEPLGLLAQVKNDRGEDGEAFKFHFYQNELALAERTEGLRGGACLAAAAALYDLYESDGQSKKADDLAANFVEYCRRCPPYRAAPVLSSFYAHVAQEAQQRNERVKAERFLIAAVEQDEKCPVPFGIRYSDHLLKLAQLYKHTGRIEQALSAALQALSKCETGQHEYGVIDTTRLLVRLYTCSGNYDEARRLLPSLIKYDHMPAQASMTCEFCCRDFLDLATLDLLQSRQQDFEKDFKKAFSCPGLEGTIDENFQRQLGAYVSELDTDGLDIPANVLLARGGGKITYRSQTRKQYMFYSGGNFSMMYTAEIIR